jgi:hypothetical protein
MLSLKYGLLVPENYYRNYYVNCYINYYRNNYTILCTESEIPNSLFINDLNNYINYYK